MSAEIDAAVRRRVAERARYRCEYCLFPEGQSGFPHQIDHILSRKHGGTADFENLAYACALCNRFKGSDIASFDANTLRVVRLFDPRGQRWPDHFSLSGPIIDPLTVIGEITTRLLRLNTADRVIERQVLQSLGLYPEAWQEST